MRSHGRHRTAASGRVLRAAVLGLLLGLPAPRPHAPLPLPVAPPLRHVFDPGLAPVVLRELPPRRAWRLAPQARPAAAAPAWQALLPAAQADDPVAACRLALLLDDCRLAADVAAMIDTQLSMAAQSGRAAQEAAAEIAALEASAEPLQRSCGDAPPALVGHGWSFLLRAAIAGHEPSMYRFVTDPPFDPAAPAEAQAALDAWQRHAGLLLGDLLRRASPHALRLAYRVAQGEALVGDRALQPRDPRAVLRLGTALAVVQEDDSARSVELAEVEAELSPAQTRQARTEGARLALHFLQPREPTAPSGSDECAAGWPGRASAWVAYGY